MKRPGTSDAVERAEEPDEPDRGHQRAEAVVGTPPPGEQAGADERPADQRRRTPRPRSASSSAWSLASDDRHGADAGRRGPRGRAPISAARSDLIAAAPPSASPESSVLGEEAARAAAHDQLGRVGPVAARGQDDRGRASVLGDPRGDVEAVARRAAGRRAGRGPGAARAPRRAPSAPSAASPTTSKPSASSMRRALARKPGVVVDDQDGLRHGADCRRSAGALHIRVTAPRGGGLPHRRGRQAAALERGPRAGSLAPCRSPPNSKERP